MQLPFGSCTYSPPFGGAGVVLVVCVVVVPVNAVDSVLDWVVCKDKIIML